MIKFLSRSGVTSTNIGRADNLYMGKMDGEWKYLPCQRILWDFKGFVGDYGTSESIYKILPILYLFS